MIDKLSFVAPFLFLPRLAYDASLIHPTRAKTDKGLHIKTSLDTNDYEIGIQVNDEEFDSIKLKKDKFHGEWNYTILPHSAIKNSPCYFLTVT